MSGSEVSAGKRREAAVWIARLHSPERSASLEAGLRRWLGESPEHRAAFDMANDIWERASALPEGALARTQAAGSSWRRVAMPRPIAMAAALTAMLLTGAVAWLALRQPPLRTQIGEQRILTLEDGTRIALNTSTRVVVDYTSTQRNVRLLEGEALFEVAPKPGMPFVVSAGERAITALGTSFVVRREHRDLTVTLMEGKVSISTVGGVSDTATPRILNPGERVMYAGVSTERSDRPDLEKITAWRRGQVALDRTRLVDAVSEMNRYSQVRLGVEGSAAGEVRISGVFRAGDSLFFAQAIAETYHLEVVRRDGEIILSGNPVL